MAGRLGLVVAERVEIVEAVQEAVIVEDPDR